MIQVTKSEQNFFIVKKRSITNQKQSDAWNKISDIRAKLRNHILTNEQEKMCVYCEKKISSDSSKSNIDHFRTRNTHPHLTLLYDNLFVSCNNKNHCSSKKDNSGLANNDFSNLINPIDDDIENNFSFTTFGELTGKNEKAKFTIDVFGLNNRSLVEERKNIFLQLQNCKHMSVETIFETLQCHKSFLKYIISA